MMQLNVMKMLKKRGKSYIWLYHRMGMSYRNYMNMIQNKTKAIQYEKLEIMCRELKCSPDDLIVYVKEPKRSKKVDK